MTACRRLNVGFVLACVLSIAGLGSADEPSSKQQALPIIDVHFHPAPTWDLHALVKLFDELGVAAAGNGARDSDALALKFSQQNPSRFIPFGGNEPIRQLISREGERAWTLQSAAATDYLAQLETAVRDKRYQGIGEARSEQHLQPLGQGSEVSGRFAIDAAAVDALGQVRCPSQCASRRDARFPGTDGTIARLRPHRNWIWAHTGWLPSSTSAAVAAAVAGPSESLLRAVRAGGASGVSTVVTRSTTTGCEARVESVARRLPRPVRHRYGRGPGDHGGLRRGDRILARHPCAAVAGNRGEARPRQRRAAVEVPISVEPIAVHERVTGERKSAGAFGALEAPVIV